MNKSDKKFISVWIATIIVVWLFITAIKVLATGMAIHSFGVCILAFVPMILALDISHKLKKVK